MDLTTQTPAQVDLALAPLLQERNRIAGSVAQAEKRRDEIYATIAESDGRWITDREHATLDKLGMDIDRGHAALAALDLAAAPLHAEHRRRGGWTRFYLVQGPGGHVHIGTACSTCFTTTVFFWLPEHSGLGEAAFVEIAGEDACTVCFPSAPVDVLSRPSKLTTPERESGAGRPQRRAGREARSERDRSA